MSIWGSSDVAGETEDGEFDGSVVSYISGWSNHYPGHFDHDKDSLPNEETPAAVGTGWIPPWCVPGHYEAERHGLDVDTHLGPWLRLDITMRAVSVWSGEPVVGEQDVHSVCLNEQAVTALRDNLNEWLQREKVHPCEEAA